MSSKGLNPRAMLAKPDYIPTDDDQEGINQKHRLKLLQKADAAGANVAPVTGIVNVVQASGSNNPGGKPKPLDGTIPKASSTVTKPVTIPGQSRLHQQPLIKKHRPVIKSHKIVIKSHVVVIKSQRLIVKSLTKNQLKY